MARLVFSEILPLQELNYKWAPFCEIFCLLYSSYPLSHSDLLSFVFILHLLRSAQEEESRVRAKLQGEVRNLRAELDSARDSLEEEQEAQNDLQRLMTKANNEANVWRQKCQSGEGGVRSEELDEMKKKLSAKLAEMESSLDASNTKVASLDKVKTRLQNELEDVMVEVERVRTNDNH